jgi:phage gp29-like protein
MNFIKTAFRAVKSAWNDTGTLPVNTKNLSNNLNCTQVKKEGRYLPHDLKSTFQTRLDIKDWKDAEELYYSQDPKTYALQIILSDIMKDAFLTSQVENRLQQIFSFDIRLTKPNGEVDDEQSKALKNMPIYRFLTRKSHEKLFYEYSHVELSIGQTIEGRKYLIGDLIPRTNFIPQLGLFYNDYTDDTKTVAYRDMPEFGTWILEFWNKEMPLLNKAVPYVLFKRFAESCHSELCEIYGIPPRWLKTNTQDKKMMDRAQKMMKDMGAASWFIIDEEEEFGFAEAAVNTNGDVYTSLTNTCCNNLGLLIVGAILGQDTKNGSRSKDEVAQDMLSLLVQSDSAMIAEDWNNIILPALKKHGMTKGDLTFGFVPSENTAQLFERVIKVLQYYEIEPKWFEEKFGIPITAKRESTNPDKDKEAEEKEKSGKKLNADLLGEEDFFGQARQRLSA